MLLTLILIGAGIRSLRPPAGGCLSRSVAADGRDHHPMAGPCRRGSGAADHRAGRARHERHSAHRPRMRSISLYGLSDVILTFEDGTDNYFARQQVFNRIAERRACPSGVAPSVSPLSSPSGLIYRYVLQSPDRSPMELKTFEDWMVEPPIQIRARRGRRFRLRRRHHAVSGAARSRQDRRRRPVGGAGGKRAVGQQLQCRRRLLFAGRPVLLRARRWAASSRRKISAMSWWR